MFSLQAKVKSKELLRSCILAKLMEILLKSQILQELVLWSKRLIKSKLRKRKKESLERTIRKIEERRRQERRRFRERDRDRKGNSRDRRRPRFRQRSNRRRRSSDSGSSSGRSNSSSSSSGSKRSSSSSSGVSSRS